MRRFRCSAPSCCPDSCRFTFGLCVGCVHAVRVVCSGCVWVVHTLLGLCVWVVCGLCTYCWCCVFGLCVGCAHAVGVVCSGCVWVVHTLLVLCVWVVCGLCTCCWCCVFRLCVGCAHAVGVVCLGCVWVVHILLELCVRVVPSQRVQLSLPFNKSPVCTTNLQSCSCGRRSGLVTRFWVRPDANSHKSVLAFSTLRSCLIPVWRSLRSVQMLQKTGTKTMLRQHQAMLKFCCTGPNQF